MAWVIVLPLPPRNPCLPRKPLATELTIAPSLWHNLAMFVVTVSAPGGIYYSLIIEKSEITIGRTSDNDVVLQDNNVSGHHARISLRGGKFIVVDTNSTNGIYINSVLLTTPMMVDGPDDIQLATFNLRVSKIRR